MSVRTRQPRFARNFIANLLRFVVIVLISFFLSPYMVHELGAAGFGVWSLAMGLLGYLGLIDFGIRQAVNRFVAHYHAIGDHLESSQIVSTAIKLFAIASAAVILLAATLAYFSPLLFNIPASLLNDMRIVILIGGITVGMSILGGVFGGVVTGVQRFDAQCVLDILTASVRAAGTVIVLHNGLGLIALAFVHLGASVLNLVAYQYVSRALYRELRILFRYPMLPHAKVLLAFALPSFGIFALGVLAFQSDAIVIGILLPIEAVTFYAIASNLVTQARELTNSLAFLMTPRVSAIASRDSSLVGGQIVAVAKLAMLLIGPVAITFFVRGQSFIGLWMGDEYASVSGSVLAVLAVVLWAGALRAVAVNSLTGLGKQRILIPSFMAEAFVNISLSIALIKPFGVWGVALGTMIPHSVITLGFIPYYIFRSTGTARSLIYTSVVLYPVLSCVPFALTSVLIEQYFPASGLVEFFAQIIVILPLVPLAAWYLCFSPDEKKEIGDTVSRIVRRK